MPEKKILKLDASGLVRMKCKLEAKRTMIEGYTDKIPFNDTHYGSAFHKFMSTMYETSGNFATATLETQKMFNKPHEIRKGKKHLDELHLLKTCIDYWQHFQAKDNFKVLVSDGKPFVEINFSEPLLETDTHIVLAEGTIDKGGKFERGMYAVGDYKTHSLWSISSSKNNFTQTEIKEFLNQFELSPQLRFYLRMVKYLGRKHPDSPFGELIRFPLGAFIEGIFLSSKEPTQFHRSDVFMFTDADMESFERTLLKKAEELIWLDQHPEYEDMDGIVTGCCTEGKFNCRYVSVCMAKDPRVKELLLKNNFRQRPYDPLNFGKE